MARCAAACLMTMLSAPPAKPLVAKTSRGLRCGHALHQPHILPYAGIEPSFATSPVHAGPTRRCWDGSRWGATRGWGRSASSAPTGTSSGSATISISGSRSTLHINHEIHPCIVGDRVAVGRNACVHACTVGSDVVIGDGVVILDGAVVEDNVVLEPGSTVFPNKRVPSGFLYAGSPAKPVRALGAGEVAERRATQQSRARREPASYRGTGRHRQPALKFTPPYSSPARPPWPAAWWRRSSASVWYSNHLDAGEAAISIGPRTNIQDNTMIRCATAQGVSIGRASTVGHNVTINDCVIGGQTLIGIGSTVAPGTVDRRPRAAGGVGAHHAGPGAGERLDVRWQPRAQVRPAR